MCLAKAKIPAAAKTVTSAIYIKCHLSAQHMNECPLLQVFTAACVCQCEYVCWCVWVRYRQGKGVMIECVTQGMEEINRCTAWDGPFTSSKWWADTMAFKGLRTSAVDCQQTCTLSVMRAPEQVSFNFCDWSFVPAFFPQKYLPWSF